MPPFRGNVSLGVEHVPKKGRHIGVPLEPPEREGTPKCLPCAIPHSHTQNYMEHWILQGLLYEM